MPNVLIMINDIEIIEEGKEVHCMAGRQGRVFYVSCCRCWKWKWKTTQHGQGQGE